MKVDNPPKHFSWRDFEIDVETVTISYHGQTIEKPQLTKKLKVPERVEIRPLRKIWEELTL